MSDSILSPMTQTALREVMAEIGPGHEVIEVGGWLGESALLLVGLGAIRVYSIDTWLGMPEMDDFSEMARCYEIFLERTAGKPIEPIRRDSVSGLWTLFKRGVDPVLIFIDGGHQYESAYADVHCAIRLFPKAQLVLDDRPANDRECERGYREAAEKFGRTLSGGDWVGRISP